MTSIGSTPTSTSDGGGSLADELARARAREEQYRHRLAEQRERASELGRHAASIRDALRDGRPATPDRMLAEVAKHSGTALGTVRTSIWLYDDARENLVCRVLLVGGVEVTGEWTSLPTRACPAYASALGTAAAVAVPDAMNDARTAELVEYLREHDVGALLDIPLLVPGGVMGVVCHEHSGGPRAWSEQEIDFAGWVGALVAVALEAERRVAAERAARGTEARYQALVESLPVTIYAFDAKTGQLDYLSPSIERLSGLGPDHWTFDRAVPTWLGAIEPEYRADVERRLEGHDVEHLVEELVYPARFPSGRRWIRDTLGVVRDAVGRPIAVQGMFADITVLRDTELAKLEVERRYRTLLENIELIAVILDARGHVEFVNDYFLRLTGFSRAEVIGASWFDLTRTEGERDAASERYRGYIQRGGLPPRHESTIRPRRGRERRIAWTNTTLQAADGKAIGTSSLGLDITDRIELEAMQLQNRKVESLGRMAAHVAHDFNNLLTVIRGGADDLASGDPLRRAEALPDVNAAIDQATELTRALLDYGRATQVVPERRPLDEIIRGALPILKRMVTADIELAVALEADQAEVEVDPSQLRQVLVNLVTNAIDATRGHGKTVRVATRKAELGDEDARALALTRAGAYVVMAVADDGVGLSEAIRARMFEPFFTTKAPGRGTGLGLALCDSIVRRAGGTITVTSEPGRGSTFEVHLPLAGGGREAAVAPDGETV